MRLFCLKCTENFFLTLSCFACIGCCFFVSCNLYLKYVTTTFISPLRLFSLESQGRVCLQLSYFINCYSCHLFSTSGDGVIELGACMSVHSTFFLTYFTKEGIGQLHPAFFLIECVEEHRETKI